MNKMTQLLAFMQVNGNNLGYNHELQQQFEKLSKAALRELSKQLPFKEVKISFNRGGIAVSGDAHLMGMFDDQNGVYITINQSVFGNRTMNFLYRTITHMKDYTGGANNYMTDGDIIGEQVVAKIERLCNL